MRLPTPLRLLVSCAVVTLFALVSQAYGYASSSITARPLQAPRRPFAAGTVGPSTPTLTVTTADISGVPSQTVRYDLTLTNNGPNDDSYALSVGTIVTNNGTPPLPASNIVFTVGSPVQLAVNTTISFSANVRIPNNAQVGTIYTIPIQAASQNGGGAASVVITTTVLQPTPTTGPTSTPTLTTTPTSTSTSTPTLGATPTATPVCQDAYDPAGSLQSAKVIQINAPQVHILCPAGEEDWVYFGGLAGKVYTIDVPQMDNGLDLSLGLYDSNGNLLTFNDDFPRNNDPTDLKPRIHSYRVTSNGHYFIRIRDAAGGGAGGLTYTIAVNGESYGPTPTLIPELCTDLYEPDGLPEQAHLMGIREVEKNNKLCPAGDADWTKMFMKVGATYRIRTDSHNLPGADPVMVLTDRDGTTILDFNDDSNNTLDAQIDFSPAVDGFYYVQVKNVGDIGNEFIAYDLYFEQLNVSGGVAPTVASTATGLAATTTTAVIGTPTTGTATPTETAATETGTVRTPTGTPATATGTIGTPTGTAITPRPTVCPANKPYPIPCPTATGAAVGAMQGPKGAPPFINGQAKQFIDPAIEQVWARTDQVVASQRATRTWMWGPAGLWGRVELYHEANGGARQVQYFDKARMEITDWKRDRANPWFVTNGLLVQELVDGRMQIGDNEFVQNAAANISVAGDENNPDGPTYASFGHLLGKAPDRTGQTATTSLRRDGTTGSAPAQGAAQLVQYVSQTGHNIPRVFWDFFATRGPIGDGSHEDQLVDWLFAMGYPISEPYWTQVKVGGVARDVLVQAFQRRVLTYTPTNPAGWQVEMGNVGRHYYLWRYHMEP